MRRVFLDGPGVAGATLARDVVGPGGEVLARTGHHLAARSVRALLEHGVSVAFVDDEAGAGVHAPPVADLPPIQEAQTALRDLTQLLARRLAPWERQPTSRAVEEIRAARLLSSMVFTLEAVRSAGAGLAAVAADLDASAGWLPDRRPGDDLIGHSIHVALLAGRLGAAVGFSEADVTATVTAALLHDVGLLLVPEAIRRTPASRRSAVERRRYEDHALLGEAILASLTLRSPAFPLVAVEHHEHQSGGGYPHGIGGGNRILRTSDAGTAAPISLVSEIVAVADRYDRLVAPSPGERPLSPAAARQVIAAEAGPCLNAEVAAKFLGLLPPWPLGAEVRVTGADLEDAHLARQARGVVVTLHGSDPGHPSVRLVADASGQPVDPITLDLRQHASAVLEPAAAPAPALPATAAARR